MNTLPAVYRLSLAVLLRSRRTVIMALLCLFPVLASAIGAMVIVGGIAERELTGFSLVSYIIVNGYVYVLLAAVSLFYGTALISDEIDDKTITYLFMRPVPKPVLYLGKYLAYVTASALLLLPSASLCFLIAMAADPSGEAGRHLPIFLQDLAVLALGLLAYGGLYALIGTVSKRPIYVGVAFAILWESVVTFIPGYMSKMTIKHYLLSLIPHPVSQRGVLAIFEQPTSAPVSVIALLAISAGLVALGAYVFTHREYVLEQ